MFYMCVSVNRGNGGGAEVPAPPSPIPPLCPPNPSLCPIAQPPHTCPPHTQDIPTTLPPLMSPTPYSPSHTPYPTHPYHLTTSLMSTTTYCPHQFPIPILLIPYLPCSPTCHPTPPHIYKICFLLWTWKILNIFDPHLWVRSLYKAIVP